MKTYEPAPVTGEGVAFAHYIMKSDNMAMIYIETMFCYPDVTSVVKNANNKPGEPNYPWFFARNSECGYEDEATAFYVELDGWTIHAVQEDKNGISIAVYKEE